MVWYFVSFLVKQSSYLRKSWLLILNCVVVLTWQWVGLYFVIVAFPGHVHLLFALVQIRKFYERKIVIIFLPIKLNMCFGCSKEPSH